MSKAARTRLEQDIIAKITPVFREVMESDGLKVTRSLDASQVEAWDSLSHITLVVELEHQMGLVFTTDELASMATVGDFIDCVVAKGYTGDAV